VIGNYHKTDLVIPYLEKKFSSDNLQTKSIEASWPLGMCCMSDNNTLTMSCPNGEALNPAD